MKDPKGNPAPKGGFQNGGWYSGYQYINGSFAPQAGVIHQESSQQGAGKPVSSEVNRQSDAAQGLKPGTIDTFVAKQNATPNVPTGSATSGSGVLGLGTGTGSSGAYGTGTAGFGVTSPEVLNLPRLYEQLYANSGIKDIEAQLSGYDKDYTEAKGKINDNPYLSEATRVGRVAKLEQLHNERTANLRNDVATKKADVEMKLNLETKQFDINSQAAQQALSQFNTLLEMGALDGAGGDDIANITRSTGISSSMIQSAINYRKEQNTPTEIIQIDDGTNIKAVVINSKTGEVVNSTVLSNSKPRAEKEAGKTDYADMLKEDASSGLTLSQIFAIYSGYLSPDEIYQLYNSSSKYGPDKGSISNLAPYGVTQPKKDTSGRST